MIGIYLFTFVIFYLWSKFLYSNKVNPITIYSSIWLLCLIIYNCGIIRYYPLRWDTFAYIYCANIVYVIGCTLGVYISKFSIKFTNYKYMRNMVEKQKVLKAVIILTSTISGFSIIPSIISSISTYGVNLLANTSDMYFNEISAAQESAFSFSAFIFVTSIYLGIYIVNYGFHSFLMYPLIMICLFAFSKGSRGTFVIVIFLLLASVLAPGNISFLSTDVIKKNLKKAFKLFLLFAIIVVAITSVRRRGEDVYYGFLALQFLSGTAIVSILGYLASGIGCLNQFLIFPVTEEEPILFFRVFYLILNKLGITNVETTIHFETYFTPIPGNVLTYIGELYIDFQDNLFIVILLLSFIYSFSYCKLSKHDSIFYRSLYATMFVYFVLSFFASFLHAAGLWYGLIMGILFSYIIDYKVKV
ncbi:oligosaccharide repeat unit polymerase [Acidaminococcus fermentans]|uniref:O-antigen polymerase n=1 Tax=Acidaminococcus fermentans TaxID=905 RepID=UPI0008E1033E|nr:O-antigen polymerase [Acidaminococcus fermentans]SFO74393.1 oligosaccharide repeat unit polymerase [Acidaminococcus fermentans]